MAATSDMAPGRATPTSGRAAARGTTKRGPRSSRTRNRDEELQDQIERLQDDLKSIAATLAGLAGDKVSETRNLAEKEARQLGSTGRHALDEVQDEFGQMERQIKDTIREKPLTAVAGAVALGFILAVVSR